MNVGFVETGKSASIIHVVLSVDVDLEMKETKCYKKFSEGSRIRKINALDYLMHRVEL